ncbi:glycoside hydrolase family 172 protein [Flindersiella endophytica]
MPRLTSKLCHLASATAALLVISLAAPAAAAPSMSASASAPQAKTTTPAALSASATQHGPVGWETYRQLDRLTEIGSDSRTRQFSSFDRGDGNDDGFGGTYSCLRQTDAGCVIAEHEGAGEVDSIWFTRDGGTVTNTGTITVELDGTPVVSAPLQDLVDGKQGAPFVHPLVANADQSSGGVYIKVPMPYRTQMRITTQHNPLFYHVTYRQFGDPQGIVTFDPGDQALDVIAKLRASGTADPKPTQLNVRTIDRTTDIAAGTSATVASSSRPGALTQLRIRIPQLAESTPDHTRSAPPKPSPSALDPRKARWIRPDPRTAKHTARTEASDDILANTRIRLTFDGDRTVDAPLGEFFGSGLGLYTVQSLMFGIDPASRTLTAWWLMPYAGSAKVQLYNGSGTAISGLESSVTVSDNPVWKQRLDSGRTGRFRTTTNREQTELGRDHVFLETAGTGRIVGVTHTVEGRIPAGNLRNYLEGDERLFVDGSLSPDLHGTGTEDFYEGGWYFNRGPFSAPMTGNPAHEEAGGGCQYDCTGLYRLTLAEGIDFASKVRFGIEHGPGNDADAIEGSTAYWYGRTRGTLQWTDSLDVGGTTTTSRFEAVDGPVEPVALDGTATSAPVSLSLRVARDNRGVTLRRISNQTSAYQSARVTVDGTDAGLWTQPLANRQRQWLDDFYQLPAALTAGKTRITVTLTPADGSPPWSAAYYAALSTRPSAPDTTAPSQVTGLTATSGEGTAITLSWKPARDDIYAPRYVVYASTRPDFRPAPANRIGTSRASGFLHSGLDIRQTLYYRVRAVDLAGHAGALSAQASARTGDTLRIEGESLVAGATATGPIQVQGNCCGIEWSGGAQLWFTPAAPGTVTAHFELGTAGTYSLAGVQTLARDYGINVLRLDGEQLGEPFDAYHSPEVAVSGPIDYGSRQLAAGSHTLVIDVTGKNAESVSYMAGLDYLQLQLEDG